MNLLEWIKQPWPWWVSGPLIGAMVPLLLIAGNRSFGISSSLRHICAACFPAGIPYFRYRWKNESWNLLFVAGIIFGAWLAVTFLSNGPAPIDAGLEQELANYGISSNQKYLPAEIFSWQTLLEPRSLVMMVAGGFLVGFGTRYAGGCTSGHSIMGLSTLQWPSLVATICFMIGGMAMTHFLLPLILKL